VPLIALPPAPKNVKADYSETAVRLTWEAPPPPPPSTTPAAVTPAPSAPATAPPAASATAPPATVPALPPPPAFTFNVYSGSAEDHGAAPVPINPAPLTEPSFEHPGAPAGKEQCFTVRTVFAGILESDPTSPVCITPRDVFPPKAPKGLSAVAGTGMINLIWDANTDSDLAGYVVLRGEAPGDTLQPLTPAPIQETTYRDATVKPGVRYVYAIVAVDRATPPNRSPLSNKVEETAR
jgi:hypothetical protein